MTTETYTLELRLCDDAGMVSDEPVEPGSPGTLVSPDLTYRKLLNNMRARNNNPDARRPYEGAPFPCTGSAHLAGEHIRCTSPAHVGDPRSALEIATMPLDEAKQMLSRRPSGSGEAQRP